MMSKVKYTDAPDEVNEALEAGKVIDDFLPSPSQLIKKVEKEKITINLTKSNVDFFRNVAKVEGIPYQVMIDNLIDNYVKHFDR